jgi:phosphatidate cytidylyltransferase
VKKNNFIKRSLSAIVLGPIFLFAIYWGESSYFSIFSIILILGLKEFYDMFTSELSKKEKLTGVILGVIIYTLTFLYAKELIAVKWLYIVPLIILVFFIKNLYAIEKKNIFHSMGILFVGILYLTAPFSLMHLGAFMYQKYNYEIIIVTILGVWASDTGGYIFGSLFGKHKLFERISQKKTWEGVIGGVLLSILTLYICSQYFDFACLRNNLWITLGITVSVSSIYGDLVESMLKRSVGLKDSGSIIPGHGGILDRFDSFIFAIVSVVAFTKLILE